MDLSVEYRNIEQKTLFFSLRIKPKQAEFLDFCLSTWRPGRYEIQNFAKNMLQFKAFGSDKKELKMRKMDKSTWRVFCAGNEELRIEYAYYANQLDAGGSYLTDDLFYINWVNCALYVLGREEEEYNVKLNLPEHFMLACGLPQQKGKLYAKNYEELADSPLLASPKLKKIFYKAKEIDFYVWIYGDCYWNEEYIKSRFKAFSDKQIELFGDYPGNDFHFLILLLPFAFYHGVEHKNSTVICLGPTEHSKGGKLLPDLLGVSSHELFHVWNIKTIRPKEMLPYKYDKENHFETGYVAEGFTTYYGDLFLARAGVFSLAEYFEELDNQLTKHLHSFGRDKMSLASASMDLWLDGYNDLVPNRKVSIYTEGCLFAWLLDWEIRLLRPKLSLDDLMRELYKQAQKGKGYSTEMVLKLLQKICKADFSPLFERYIYGTQPILPHLHSLMGEFACKLEFKPNPSKFMSVWGAKVAMESGLLKVQRIAPQSPAFAQLSHGDEIIAIDGRKVGPSYEDMVLGKSEIELAVFRNHQLKLVKMQADGQMYFASPMLLPNELANAAALKRRHEWLGTVSAL